YVLAADVESRVTGRRRQFRAAPAESREGALANALGAGRIVGVGRRCRKRIERRDEVGVDAAGLPLAVRTRIQLITRAAVLAGLEVTGGARGFAVAAGLHLPEERLAEADRGVEVGDVVDQV